MVKNAGSNPKKPQMVWVSCLQLTTLGVDIVAVI